MSLEDVVMKEKKIIVKLITQLLFSFPSLFIFIICILFTISFIIDLCEIFTGKRVFD